jgi:hypothetical protein
MKTLRNRILSAILLLSFSLSVIPVDFFHGHRTNSDQQNSCSKTAGETCQHKNHLALKNSFCWACSVHFEKSFVTASATPILVERVGLSFTTQHAARLYKTTSIHYTLRGPPAFS